MKPKTLLLLAAAELMLLTACVLPIPRQSYTCDDVNDDVQQGYNEQRQNYANIPPIDEFKEFLRSNRGQALLEALAKELGVPQNDVEFMRNCLRTEASTP